MDRKHAVPEGSRHETRDIKVGKVALIGVVLLAVIALAGQFIPWFFFQFMVKETNPVGPPSGPVLEAQQVPPGPRLQVHPQQDLKTLRAAEDQKLSSYSWVDRDNGVVRIPISRAMELVAERGLGTPRPPGPGAGRPGSHANINPEPNSSRVPPGTSSENRK